MSSKVAMKTIYSCKGKNWSKNPNSSCNSNPRTLEFKAVTLANTPRRSPIISLTIIKFKRLILHIRLVLIGTLNTKTCFQNFFY